MLSLIRQFRQTYCAYGVFVVAFSCADGNDSSFHSSSKLAKTQLNQPLQKSDKQETEPTEELNANHGEPTAVPAPVERAISEPSPPLSHVSTGTEQMTESTPVPPDVNDADKVKGMLDNLRWDLPCSSGIDRNGVCRGPQIVKDEKVITGDSKSLFKVSLRFRGIVEPQVYSGGQNDGAYWQIGGRPQNEVFNVYSLEISSPPQVYYLNRHSATNYAELLIDFQKEIEINGGAKVTLIADTRDGLLMANRQRRMIPELAENFFFGQFIQMNVLKIEVQSQPK